MGDEEQHRADGEADHLMHGSRPLRFYGTCPCPVMLKAA
jgi:hypothetical protein